MLHNIGWRFPKCESGFHTVLRPYINYPHLSTVVVFSGTVFQSLTINNKKSVLSFASGILLHLNVNALNIMCYYVQLLRSREFWRSCQLSFPSIVLQERGKASRITSVEPQGSFIDTQPVSLALLLLLITLRVILVQGFWKAKKEVFQWCYSFVHVKPGEKWIKLFSFHHVTHLSFTVLPSQFVHFCFQTFWP